jgi:hypothetical protein
MNEIQKTIASTVVEPRLTQNALSTYGFVQDYNSFVHTATVSVFDKSANEYVIYNDVPVLDSMSGVISTDPENRTSVWVEFIGGNKNFARVTGLRDEYNRERTASDKGSGVPFIQGFFNNLGSMVSGWFGGAKNGGGSW